MEQAMTENFIEIDSAFMDYRLRVRRYADTVKCEAEEADGEGICYSRLPIVMEAQSIAAQIEAMRDTNIEARVVYQKANGEDSVMIIAGQCSRSYRIEKRMVQYPDGIERPTCFLFAPREVSDAIEKLPKSDALISFKTQQRITEIVADVLRNYNIKVRERKL